MDLQIYAILEIRWVLGLIGCATLGRRGRKTHIHYTALSKYKTLLLSMRFIFVLPVAPLVTWRTHESSTRNVHKIRAVPCQREADDVQRTTLR